MDSYDIVKKNLKRMIRFQKQSFNYAFNTMIMIQEQFETITFMVGLPVRNQVLVDQLHTNFKSNFDYIKSVVDGGFEKMESFVAPSE
ncbi:MAG: hypothetical protein KJ737_07065 [Proteobacteria bacterium]|nr:hypothetical protein [Pseudomonadota bacterium]